MARVRYVEFFMRSEVLFSLRHLFLDLMGFSSGGQSQNLANFSVPLIKQKATILITVSLW